MLHARKHPLTNRTALAGTVLGTLVGATFAGVAWTASATVDDPPPPSTIVDVSGDRDNGFVIEHYDGSVDYPPTRSEARSACEEYDAKVARVRCRTEIRVWYRDLARTERALDYARARR